MASASSSASRRAWRQYSPAFKEAALIGRGRSSAAMKRHILLAVLFGTLLACATLTRAEEEADIDDDDEDEEAEERAFLIVRRAGGNASKYLDHAAERPASGIAFCRFGSSRAALPTADKQLPRAWRAPVTAAVALPPRCCS